MNKDLAIIVAFYLSKFNKAALSSLNYKTDKEAFRAIGQILDVKENYIKFRRDEFDPIHPWRKGWQRRMDKRTVRAIETLQDLNESELRSIVLDILNDESYRQSEELSRVVSLFSVDKDERSIQGNFILRAPTGRAAEDFFIEYHRQTNTPVTGVLVDCRDLGCGYDFRIDSGLNEKYVEVKGLAEVSGGILFTDKEWRTANEYPDKYILCIVKNIPVNPIISFISNPAQKLKAKKNIYTTIQINWGVPQNQLENIND